MTYRICLAILALVSTLFTALPTHAQSTDTPGAVYAMTNADAGNEIVVYRRGSDGLLTQTGIYPTGGLGKTTEPNDALGAQYPLVLSPDQRWLFAVNAGSNTISVFQVNADGLTLLQQIGSGGDFPVSLTLHQALLYVLNAGGDANISGFSLDSGGRLTPLDGSTRSLNAGGTNPPDFLDSPAEVGFNPLGDKLVVTVKGARSSSPKIHVFTVDGNGLPSTQPVTTVTNVSFGFVFDDLNNLVVAEPFGSNAPSPGTGAAASYRIAADGSLAAISTSVLNKQTATCWIAITTNTRFSYTTNNGTGTISSYKVNADGSLSLINETAASIGVDAAPVDLAITPNNQYVYNVNAGHGTVSMFMIDQANGNLISLGEIGGLPSNGSAVGIAAR
jgi:6-phosphogluconolactonase